MQQNSEREAKVRIWKVQYARIWLTEFARQPFVRNSGQRPVGKMKRTYMTMKYTLKYQQISKYKRKSVTEPLHGNTVQQMGNTLFYLSMSTDRSSLTFTRLLFWILYCADEDGVWTTNMSFTLISCADCSPQVSCDEMLEILTGGLLFFFSSNSERFWWERASVCF